MAVAESKTANLSASLEDYLEAIFNIAGRRETVRSKDIAESLGVSMPSVTGALRLLKRKGLANYRPYDCATLTASGRAAAAEIARKHDILKAFFADVLGVESELAQKAACRAEHSLGPEIITRLLYFMEFVNESSRDGHDLAARFEKFCSGKLPRSGRKPPGRRKAGR